MIQVHDAYQCDHNKAANQIINTKTPLIVTSRACGWAIAGLLDHGYFPGMVGMNDALEPENLISTQMNI